MVIVDLFSRQRAERLAQLLDDGDGAPRHSRNRHDQDLAPLVRTSQQLSGITSTVTIDPAFRSALRQRLLDIAAVQGIGVTTEPAPRQRQYSPSRVPARRTRARLALAVGSVVGVLAVSGVSAASGSAMPGDTLYDVKRSTERAQIALAGSDVNSGQLYLQFARTRASEARAVRHNPVSLTNVLRDMDRQTAQGVRLLTTAAVERHDPPALDVVDGFVVQQRRSVADLIPLLSDVSRERALSSLTLLDTVQRRSESLRARLLCTAASDTQYDALGPLPRNCAALPASGQGPSAGQANGQGQQSQQPGPGAPRAPAASPSPTPGKSGGLLPGLDPSIGISVSGGTPSSNPSDDDGLIGELGRILGGLLG